jgi:hypothetical protein
METCLDFSLKQMKKQTVTAEKNIEKQQTTLNIIKVQITKIQESYSF